MKDSLTDYAAARGMTLKEFAKHVGLSESTLKRRAKGERRPQTSKMRQIARKLGITQDDVLAMVAAEQQAQAEDLQRRALRLPIALCRAITTDPTTPINDQGKLAKRLTTLIKSAEAARAALVARSPEDLAPTRLPKIKPRPQECLPSNV